MIKTYESFEELADTMTDGEGILHLYNCAKNEKDPFYDDPCMSWQKGVTDFAEWLDHIGLKVEIPDKAEDFYDFLRRGFKDKIDEAK